MSVFEKVVTALKTNREREYTPEQMRDHLQRKGNGSYHVDVVSRALKRAKELNVATRVRDGKEPFRYRARRGRRR